jgi:pimeloyl-ACP methyl ester carboxylesterase
MPNVSVNGVQLEYVEAGAGTPIIFSHEFAGSRESWEPQIAALARRYRCIAYNNRGYPPSSVPDDPAAYSEEQLVDDLRALMDALGIERAFLCGLSMGGGVVLKFGLRHPERCLGLVVAGAGSGSVERATFEAGMAANLDRLDRGDIDAWVEATGSSPTRVRLRRKNPLGFERFRDLLAQHSAAGSAHILRGVQLRRTTILQSEDALRGRRPPVLVLVGDEDAPCIEAALLMKRTIPDCGLMMFPKSGHAINLEEPELFNRAVLDFVTAVEGGVWSADVAGREPAVSR